LRPATVEQINTEHNNILKQKYVIRKEDDYVGEGVEFWVSLVLSFFSSFHDNDVYFRLATSNSRIDKYRTAVETHYNNTI